MRPSIEVSPLETKALAESRANHFLATAKRDDVLHSTSKYSFDSGQMELVKQQWKFLKRDLVLIAVGVPEPLCQKVMTKRVWKYNTFMFKLSNGTL
jgi:hypothetical protein